jgi:RNA polymerase sigma factor (TIGR02999 family)
MEALRNGDGRAAGQLVELFYPELRRIAAARMRSERVEHTWRPTALVNELYLELVKIKALRAAGGEGRNQFLALAAYLMKRLLIHHSRRVGSKAEKIELPELPDPHTSGSEAIHQVDSALDQLAAINPSLRRVVELRVFEGLTREEIAARLGCSTATVARNWSFARKWLEQEFTNCITP